MNTYRDTNITVKARSYGRERRLSPDGKSAWTIRAPTGRRIRRDQSHETRVLAAQFARVIADRRMARFHRALTIFVKLGSRAHDSVNPVDDIVVPALFAARAVSL